VKPAILASILLLGFATVARAERPADLPAPRIGAQLPLDASFHDETGRAVKIGDYFHSGKPVILHLMYFRCPMVCGKAMNAFVDALMQMPPEWSVGDKFDVLTVSFDALEKPDLAAAKKKSTMELYNRPSASSGAVRGWHFLTGDEPSIKTLIDSVGFYREWNKEGNQFDHDVELIVVSPEGRATHFLQMQSYDPTTLRLALVESSQGKIGSLGDRAALFACFSFDPVTGKYQLAAVKLLRMTGVGVVILLGAFIALLIWLRRRRDRQSRSAKQPTSQQQTSRLTA
jgi:protein SCO1/2